MKIISIKQNGIIRDIKENELGSIVGGYSIVGFRNTKEHTVVDYKNSVVSVYNLRRKIA